MTSSTLALLAGLPLLCVTLSSESMAEPQCHANDRYQVVAEPFPDDAGNRFAVHRLNGATAVGCVFDAEKADLVIGATGDPLWFGELSGDSLILSRSTGPQGDLVVYDLTTGNPVLDVPADEFELEGGRLVFWQRMAQATAATCPSFAENEANGLGSVIAMQKSLDLSTGAITNTDRSKCVAVQ